MAIGDFNGDDKLDMAVANASSNNVSILLGAGDGTFGAATNFVVGDFPVSVVVGDFDGDGIQDLAVANLGSDNVSILLGTGTGSFRVAANFGVRDSPFSVAVGDFNGDGIQDLAVANAGSDNVSILLGTGTGSFGAARNFAVGSRPFSVVVGDFNADGKLDLATVSQRSEAVFILLNTASTSSLTFTLTATNGGTGTGTVISDFPGISCGADCSQAYVDDTLVTLTAIADAASFFAGWSGCDSVSGNSCTVTMDADTTVTADFDLIPTFTFTVNKLGNGTVTSLPAGINCGGDCDENYTPGTVVTLAAVRDASSFFAGFGGDADCLDGVVTMDSDKNCTATFNLLTPLVLSAALPPEGEVGVAYNFDLPISGGAPPYDVTIIKGFLPSGLGLGSPKIIGTPAVATVKRFTVQVTDQLGSSVTGIFKITIFRALGISTNSLKAGINGRAYRGVLRAIGGKKPYGWSLVGGSLPSGLALNSVTGAITGIPTQTGIFNLTFQVTDPAGGIAQKALTLTIK